MNALRYSSRLYRNFGTSSKKMRDLAELKELQRQFQVDDGVPVYLKRGPRDKIFFSVVCLGLAIATFNKEGKEPKVERIKESFDNSSHHWDKKFHPFIQNQWVYSTYCESSVVALPPVTWASNQFRIVTDDAGIGILLTKGLSYIGVHFYSTGTGENYEDFGFRLFFRLRKMHADQSELLQKIIDTQMGRITPQTETHYGDPGTSIMDPDESTDFWDNSFLRTEHPLKQILPIEDSEQKNKPLRNNDEIQTANMPVIPPADRLYRKLTDEKTEIGDAVDGETDSKDREMFMDASRDFVLHLYLNDDEVEEYNKKVSERMKSRTTISELTLEMYKATISSLMHVLNCFSKHAGLPDVQCKNDYKQNCIWVRIPEILDCNIINDKGDIPHAYQPVLNDNTGTYRDAHAESADFPVLHSTAEL
ncbi:hypothetical protein HNY73_021800 [Argiope bruennichi]|uniref:Uncharacterized protein n=1 Tax=Argiope bruennichi TaxID=94029 RepID=A0A8T0DZP3_ARGBR|nr:hypothetical protein HNY73_021800 [Argiope bruennichi]